MHDSALAAWESFYVIVGSSAGGLTGLMFVVITLIAESRTRSSGQTISAFGTPTIVHFCAVLLLSATLSAPWQHLWSAAVAVGVPAAAEVAYTVIVIGRARRQTGYQPVAEDWIFHAVLPLLAYVTLLAGALALTRYPGPTLFAMAGSAVLLLFIGIHNAWDTVTYIAVVRPMERERERETERERKRNAGNRRSGGPRRRRDRMPRSLRDHESDGG